MGKLIGNIIFGLLLLLFAIILVLRVSLGSFEEVGERIDEFLPIAYERAGEAARELGEDVEQVIEDVADGPDDAN